MMLSLKTQPQPFRFLLYTEWLMLASCGAMAAFEGWELRSIPVQHILILVSLGLMGWMLPNGKTPFRYLYTAIEMGLIFYGTTLGYLHILPTLYLIVLIRSCFLFEPPGRWVVAGLSLTLFLVHQAQYLQTIMPLLLSNAQQQQIWMHQVAEVLMFGLGLFFVSQLVSTLLAERKAQEQLSLAHEQLREYALQIEDLAAVQERNRIAREIHDSLGHALTTLNVQVQTALKLWQHDPIKAKPFLEQAQRLGKVAMQEVRQSVHALRADAVAEEPLEQAIAALVREFSQSTGIEVLTKIDLQTVLPAPMAKTIYRVVQEALTNICKHAEATSVQLNLRQATDRIYLSIRDNGCGFQPQAKLGGFGLHSMQERIVALHGSFRVETEPQTGCCIVVELPLQEALR
ncbi:MAG: sensor histidine kinase [Timaviella obliquedivisa GSE-PSE-MK23-08B]|jgi:signal transduction histidine kinase|nr:sensor histidine kinase [Timaviella obliquedivisa GSE-PSE-MK23-08B]